MALTFNGTGTINISGNVTSTQEEITGQTFISGTVAGNTSATIGTVGAGKRWKILMINLTSMNSNTNSGIASLNLAGVRALRHDYTGAASAFPSNSSTSRFDYYACPILTAGQTIVIQNTAIGLISSGSICYVEEAV